MRYVYRSTTRQEQSLYNGSNATVVDTILNDTICFTGSGAESQRIAAALCILNKFTLDELTAMAKAMKP